MTKKVGIYVGHGISTNGSFDTGTTFGGHTEADYMLPIVQSAVKYLEISGVTVYTDANKKNNINMIKQVELSNSKGVDVHVAVHCDYFKAPTGTMPLYLSAEGKKLADDMNKYVTTDMKMVTRGVTKRTDLYELNASNAVACIFECGSIDDDYSKFLDYDKYGKAIAKGICAYLGVTFKASKVKSKVTYTQTYSQNKLPIRPLRGYFKIGDHGTNVLRLQKFLNWAINAKLVLDGKFGTGTFAAVKRFQKIYKLKIDGLFGASCLKIAKTIKK